MTIHPTTEALLGEADFVRGLSRGLVYDQAAAEDVAQSTLLAALENPPAELTSGRGWLAAVARNVARQMGRSAGRRSAREASVARPEDAVPSTVEILELEEVRRRVVDAVLELPEEDRTVVALRYYESLAPREIAQRLGTTANAVSSRLSRAHAKLRERLDHLHGSRAAWVFALGPFLAVPAAEAAALAGAGTAAVGGGTPARWWAGGAAALAGVGVLGLLLWSASPDPVSPEPLGGPSAGGARVEDPPRRDEPREAAPAVPRTNSKPVPAAAGDAEAAAPAQAEPAAAPPADAPEAPAAPASNRLLAGRVLGHDGEPRELEFIVGGSMSNGSRLGPRIHPADRRYRALKTSVGADGRFTLDLQPWFDAAQGQASDMFQDAEPQVIGTYLGASGRQWVSLSFLEAAAARAPAVDGGAAPRYWLEIVGAKRSLIEGSLRDAGGDTPPAFSSVRAFRLIDGRPTVDTLGTTLQWDDKSGRFVIGVAPGTRWLVVGSHAQRLPVAVVVEAPPSGAVAIDPLELRPGSDCTGTLVLEGGAPMPGFYMRATPVLAGGAVAVPETSLVWDLASGVCGWALSAETNAQGEYTFRGMSAMAYDVTVASTWKMGVPEAVRFTPPADAPTVQVAAGGLLVRVQAGGKDLPRGWAELQPVPGTSDDSPVFKALGPKGRRGVAREGIGARFLPLPPAQYLLTLHAPGYVSKSFTVTVRVGEVLQESGELERADEKR